MKDLFSDSSDKYLQYRPQYPFEIQSFLSSLLSKDSAVLDCGTGNGQFAIVLAQYFNQIFATDISAEQIKNAIAHKHITYSVQKGETLDFPSLYFDLITVAQAIHWFNFDKFYAEVDRTLKPNGFIAIIGYGLLNTFNVVDDIIAHFYTNIIGTYWDKERKYIDENYQTIPFPFQEVEIPKFQNIQKWNLEHLIGYLNTWSAVKQYIKVNGNNPVDLIYQDLALKWGIEEYRTVCFPILMRVGQKIIH